MSTTEFSHNAADLGGLITIQPDKKTSVFPADKTFAADKSGKISVSTTLGTDFSATTLTEGQIGTLTQNGSTIGFVSPGFPNLTLADDGDPTISLDGAFGDVSLRGTLSQDGAKSFEIGVDPVTFELGVTPDDDETLALDIGTDAFGIGATGVNGTLTTLDGRLAVDPLLLEVEYNPNTEVVVANAAAESSFDLDDAIRLSIFARAGLSSDPTVDPTYEGGFVLNASF